MHKTHENERRGERRIRYKARNQDKEAMYKTQDGKKTQQCR